MSERHADVLEVFYSTGTEGPSDGTLERPFPSLDAVLAALLEDRVPPLAASDTRGRHIEIVRLEKRGEAGYRKSRPRFEFFLDDHTLSEGNGTDRAPWPSVPEAAAALRRRAKDDDLQLRVGERLRLTYREVFTATSLERRKKAVESLAHAVFMLMALVCVVPVLAIIGFLVWKALPTLSVDFLLDNPEQRLVAGGIWSPLIGTFLLVLTSLVVAAPIGILAGVYLNEYAGKNWLTRMINLAVMNLAGVPSIVHALFGLGAFVHFAGMGRSLMAAACTVAVMTLPVIITSTREALAAVPMPFRVACWNLGASRWQTIRTIVLPNSVAGILTGVILQVARAAGETAPILFTGAILYSRVPDSGWEKYLPFGLDEPFMALSYHLFALSTQVRDVPDELLYGTAVVLIGLVLLVNSLSIAVRIYLRSRKRW